MAKKAKKAGRPSLFTEKLALRICERLSNGESLRKICLDEGMPEARTVHYWLLDKSHEGFFQQYARAREIQAENMFDEILDIADKSDEVVKSGAEKKSSAYSQNQRLRVDTRKWYLSKVLPKKFGDKLDLTSDNKPIPLLHVLHPKDVPDNNSNTQDSSTPKENSSGSGGNIGL